MTDSEQYTTRWRVRWQFGNDLVREKWFYDERVAIRYGKRQVLRGADVVSVVPIHRALTRREEGRAS